VFLPDMRLAVVSIVPFFRSADYGIKKFQ